MFSFLKNIKDLFNFSYDICETGGRDAPDMNTSISPEYVLRNM